MKIETYLINSVDCHYVIDFFYTDYKVLKYKLLLYKIIEKHQLIYGHNFIYNY